jgi:hypothetical protein
MTDPRRGQYTEEEGGNGQMKEFLQRTAARSRWLLLVAVPLAIVVSVGAASASGGAFASKAAMPDASGHMQKVIILLRSKSAGLSAGTKARSAVVRATERPVTAALRSHGAKGIVGGTTLPFVAASVSSAQEKALGASPAVKAVLPDSVIPASTSSASPDANPFLSTPGTASPTTISAPCGTAAAPENDPEANGVVKATQANALGYTGKGVKVAYIAGPIDTSLPDFKRNPKYASAGSPAGSPVVTALNFAGDPADTPSGDDAAESFLDASSIAAQGNTIFDLSDYVSTANPLPKPCDIRITGAAPGASVLGLDVFSGEHLTTTSNFIQAIDYAISHGVKVLNESFGGNPFPDTALDALRIADDQAVAANVTVVVSTGDAGITSTLGSPSTDPKLISVGGSTTFRAYQQDTYGGINATVPNATNGTWINNNISSLSSGGFAQGNGANTVDLVAPGDLNWLLCSPNAALFTSCLNENGAPSGIQITGGTSESTPIASAAAADVIQAYRKTHHGETPSPALVKKFLVSTATDIDAPAEQQGAGLLNVLAAVRAAVTYHRPVDVPGALLTDPSQINVQQGIHHTASRLVHITNTFHHPVTVHLSTRTLRHEAASQTGSFCLNPSSADIACGPPTANSFQIWSGVTEVYQEETFTVPATGKPSRLNFSADYQYTGQTSLLHVALYDPSGAYAGYSLPQGLADYANVQVADPKPGTWTAVFFTEKNGDTPGGVGTSGTIQWEADTWTFGHAGTISPSTLTIGPGGTQVATFTTDRGTPGDRAESIVLNSVAGRNTIPVTVRTTVPMGPAGGLFNGVLTGGNGRGNPAQTNTYTFRVPKGLHDVEVSTTFADLNDGVVAYLINPEGEAVASSSNVTFDSTGANVIGTNAVNVFKDNPEPGEWQFVLDWLQPVSGTEISEPFTGRVRFNSVRASSTLPHGGAELEQGHTYTFGVKVTNTADTPEAFFLDPRTTANTTIDLPDQNGSDEDMTLPLPPGLTFPLYVVPPDTSRVQASMTGSAPVTFDLSAFPGDPDLSPAIPAPGVTRSQADDHASLTFTPAGGELAPGLWALVPSEIGPYPATGAPAVKASASVSIVTKGFDQTVSPSTGDLWTFLNGFTSTFDPVYLQPGESAVIPLSITPTASPGTRVSGVINLDDVFQANFVTGFVNAGGDELASLPFSYEVTG